MSERRPRTVPGTCPCIVERTAAYAVFCLALPVYDRQQRAHIVHVAERVAAIEAELRGVQGTVNAKAIDEVRVVMMRETLLGVTYVKDPRDSRMITTEGEPFWDVIARIAVALGARADGALEDELHGPCHRLGGS